MPKPSATLRSLCKAITEKGLGGKTALVHEAAIDAWGLDNNANPYGLDLAANTHWSACGIAEALGEEEPRLVKYKAGYAWETRFEGVPLRVWPRYAGVPFRKLETVEHQALDVRCADPFTVLENFPDSPDIFCLYEIRAALAACLYVDDMSQDQLRRFIEYVRPC